MRCRKVVRACGRLARARNVSVGDHAFDPARGIQDAFQMLGRNDDLSAALRRVNLRVAFGYRAPRVVLVVEFYPDLLGRKLARALSHDCRTAEYEGALGAVNFEAAPACVHGQAARLIRRREIEFHPVLDAHHRVTRAVADSHAAALPGGKTKLYG